MPEHRTVAPALAVNINKHASGKMLAQLDTLAPHAAEDGSAPGWTAARVVEALTAADSHGEGERGQSAE